MAVPKDTLASLRGRIERLIEERGRSNQQYLDLYNRYTKLYKALQSLGHDPDKILAEK